MARFIGGQIKTGHERNNVFANGIHATHVGGFHEPLVGRDPV